MFNGTNNGVSGFGDAGHVQATFNALAKKIATKRKKNLTPAEMSALQQIVQHAYAEVATRNRRQGAPLTGQQEDDAARVILRGVASKYGISI